MSSVNFKKVIKSSVDDAINQIEAALKTEGFGILTRIDLHSKIKEKLNKDLPQTVILGACNPALAYEAFLKNSDIASLLPCNVVIRDVGQGKVSVELAKPTVMMQMLGDQDLVNLAKPADDQLAKVLETI